MNPSKKYGSNLLNLKPIPNTELSENAKRTFAQIWHARCEVTFKEALLLFEGEVYNEVGRRITKGKVCQVGEFVVLQQPLTLTAGSPYISVSWSMPAGHAYYLQRTNEKTVFCTIEGNKHSFGTQLTIKVGKVIRPEKS